jgi:hypothetical protein
MERQMCTRCGGTGRIEHQRSRWIGGGKTGYRSEWTVFEACDCGGRAMFEIEGRQVNAPGFDSDEQFLGFVERAKAAQLRTTPGRSAVLVSSGSGDARYRVTRTSCDCTGHLTHGRCWHRAYAIWLHDVAGVDVMRVPVIGVSRRGVPLTTGRKPATRKDAA